MPTVKSKTTTTVTMTTHLDRKAVVLSDEDEALVAEWAEMKEQRKALDASIKERTERFDALFADGAEVAIHNGRVRLVASQRERESTDREVLATGYPEAYEASKRTTSYTVYTSK